MGNLQKIDRNHQPEAVQITPKWLKRESLA
jgi:hypothetical protein